MDILMWEAFCKYHPEPVRMEFEGYNEEDEGVWKCPECGNEGKVPYELLKQLLMAS